MAHVFQQVIEPYSAEKMFSLVNDIACYPQFVPNCIAADIISQQDNLVKAFIEVEKLGFKQAFTTINRLNPYQSIEVRLLEGPFKHLIGDWQFTPLSENSCKINFELEFEFKNKLLNVAFTPIFKEVMINMVSAFTNRARQIY